MKHALRNLRRSPGFALTSIVTIALAVAADATAFTVLDHLLLRSLPYGDAGRLYSLFQQGGPGNQRLPSYLSFTDWQRDSRSFAGMAFIRGTGVVMRTSEGRFRVVQGFVSPGFFRIMGRAPLLGRTFAANDETAAGPDVAVLSYRFWREQFGGDSSVIGRAIALDSSSTVVIGVMPPGFDYPAYWSVWRPLAHLAAGDQALTNRAFHVDSRVVARLAPGVDSARAMTELGSIQRRLAQAYPEEGREWTGAAARPLRDEVLGSVRPRILLISAAAALVLIIACANLGGLGLVRAATRGREMAIRIALGASARRLGVQLAVEGACLAALGGALGAALTYAAAAWLRASVPFGLPRAEDLTVDGRVLTLGAALPLATILIVSMAPALYLVIAGGTESLIGRRSTGGATRRESRSRNLFTAAQFAVAVHLLVGTGLLGRSYRHLSARTLGYDAEHLLTLHIVPPRAQYPNAPALRTLYERLLSQLAAVRGVEEVALINFFGGPGSGIPTPLELPGRPPRADDQVMYRVASDAYLRATHIPLLSGRWFTADEMRSPGDAVVVSESVAKRYWPNASAIGQPITVFRSSQASPDFGKRAPSVVVGVVDDVPVIGAAGQPSLELYVPYSSEPWPHVELVARVTHPTPELGAALRKAVSDVDPDIGAMSTRMDEPFRVVPSVQSELAPQRYLLGLVGVLGVYALFLASVGIFAVTGYTVARRMHEFGVRMALGATPRNVLGLVVKRGVILATVGVGAGLLSALALTRWLQRLLFETSPTDASVFIAAPAVLLAVAAIASYLPARRAARADPVSALAQE